MIEIIITVGIISYLASNIWVSFYIGKAPGYEFIQKIIQILFIWLLPFVGAAVFSWFLWNDRKAHPSNRDIGNDILGNNDAIDLMVSSNDHGD